MVRMVVLGRGAAGKSALAARLGAITGAPVIELDTVFWNADLTVTPPAEWAAVQRDLAAGSSWILDGDLGPYDVLDVRLRRADTVVVLDLSLARCAWRALRRSRERIDFWRWVVTYRRRWLPAIMAAIAQRAPDARVHVLHRPRDVRELVRGTGGAASPSP
ncbi:hypothetical protein [Pseudonocardia sp. GCM10023141]|uniref:hypothetical protein n=1 Tax=Pseudonocardia sp. GCM10023141 TaxID=3252653 RepID=UPI00360CD502